MTLRFRLQAAVIVHPYEQHYWESYHSTGGEKEVKLQPIWLRLLSVFFVPAIMLGAQDSASKGRPSSPAAKVTQRPDARPAAPSEEFIIGCEDVLSINVW